MRFHFVDAVIEQTPERIVALKHVAAGEEYLQDHFPTFPVLPGVLMLEALVHAARTLLAKHPSAPARLTLGEARALKFGAFVKPGDTLVLEVNLLASPEDSTSADAGWSFRGKAIARSPAGVEDIAAAGRFTLRPVRAASQQSRPVRASAEPADPSCQRGA